MSGNPSNSGATAPMQQQSTKPLDGPPQAGHKVDDVYSDDFVSPNISPRDSAAAIAKGLVNTAVVSGTLKAKSSSIKTFFYF